MGDDEQINDNLRAELPDDSNVNNTSVLSNSNNAKIAKEEQLYPFYHGNTSSNRPAKRQKKQHYSAEIIVEIEDRNGDLVPIRALLDTGTSSTIILRQFVKRGRAKSYKGHRTKWST